MLSDPMMPLLMLSYDLLPDLRIGDVGQLHYFIHPNDLAALRFDRVRVQLQGG